ncbi:CehA/McbA family metallohydrolase [Persicimonas caeni]|nr:CehA/McbA family metallohydrolase [Persicimonas caeni]
MLTMGATCGSDSNENFPLIDAGGDVKSDIGDTSPSTRVAVPIALDDYLEDNESTDTVKVYQVESNDELADGPVTEARVGDWVLENGRVKLFVEGTDRAMSPCPWGGNIVDAQYKRDDGTWTDDVTGEICLMVNVGQTFAPEEFEVLRDGSDGGPAVLAVSGRLELLDFLNISAMANDYAPGILDRVALDPDKIVPAKLTRYLILHPGDTGVRVVTALRNDGEETAHMAVGHLMRGGAHGNYFNPLNSLGGWGYRSLGADNLNGDTLPFVAYAGPEGGYAYLPKPDPNLRPSAEALPRGGVQVSISGVTVSLLGRDSVLQTLLASESRIKTLEGLYHLEPQEIGIVEHWEFFGDDKLNSMVDPIYDRLQIERGTIAGRVTDSTGQPVAGALVTAIDAEDRGMNQTRTNADGEYEMTVPTGAYTVRARLDGRVSREAPSLSIAHTQRGDADLVLKDPARIEVNVRTPADEPTPARVMVTCVDTCPDMPTSQERDVSLDSLPSNVSRIVSVGVDGQASIELPAGEYRVAVTRGMEWSIWPHNAADDGGYLVDLAEGESIALDAEIARVVDTSGAISADFHVHGVTSPDSIVRKHNRVKNFMGEGVDVLISTDHDFISDYGPEIARQGAGHEITSVVGAEITTPHLGHFNAFPLVRDPAHRRGGALDWARGTDYDMTPAEVFKWVDEQDGNPDNAQVKQINHPGSTIPPLKADVLRGITLADPETKRLDPSLTGSGGQDTGLWSDDFSAIEMMNGHSMGRVWTVMRWWLSMVSRGFSPTATAVTDTHKLYSDLGGSPRTFVFVGDDHDTPQTFDAQAFAAASNNNRAIGTNGPFFRVELENSSGETATLGETLAADDGQVTARITIDVPEWMQVDTIDVYSNLPADAIVTAPGGSIDDPIAPTSSHPFTFEQSDLVEVASGDHTHSHWTKTVDIPLDISADAYVVFVVRGSNHMYPVIPSTGVMPFAFSNPVFVDADGNGYDNPPLEALAQTPLEPMMLQKAAPAPFEGQLTPEELGGFIEKYGHKH